MKNPLSLPLKYQIFKVEKNCFCLKLFVTIKIDGYFETNIVLSLIIENYEKPLRKEKYSVDFKEKR